LTGGSLLFSDGQVHHDTHVIPLGNNVTRRLGNYVLTSRSRLGNYVIADTTQHAASLVAHSQVLQDLTEERTARAPDTVTRLLTHLLQGTQRPFYDCYSLRQIVEIMQRQPVPADVSGIAEQAFRLGCSDLSTQ
jgi:hypothetical protein